MGRRYGLEIRGATEADAPGLAALLAGAGHPVSAGDLAARIEALRRADGAALVAVEWGPPSGLVALHWHASLTEPRPVAGIDLLLVDPEARRRGLGRLLLKAGAQAARQAGCARLRLRLDAGQADLAAFCAATGFAADGACLVRALRKASG